ncbi:GMP/IMP nucleotidase [Marinobacter sp.]|uniref:GMP/IMP nucleotidase n=1 Tax=Marinobacter sp. TaxID=50741 RepID=UPI003568C925
MINWFKADQVFLDMDGTLLDLHFDNHFWLEHLPLRYGEANRLSPQQARDLIVPMIMAERGSLNWYCTDYWSERLSLDITALKAEVGNRIAYRPGVKQFLRALRRNRLTPIILTNCHPDPLKLKLDRTGLDQFVDRVISSHDLGAAKEEQAFWDRLLDHHSHHRERAIMVDDSLPVLESAHRAGIGQCLAILAPDSQQPDREPHPEFPAVRHFDEVLPALSGHGSAKPSA